MKKSKFRFGVALLVTLVVIPAILVVAGMRNVVFTSTVSGIISSAATGSVTKVIRGEIDSIYVDLTAGATGTVTVTDDYGTIFTLAGIAADTQYFPRRAGQTTVGGALTAVYTNIAGEGGTLVGEAAGYSRYWAAGPVTVKVVNQTVDVTNTMAVTIIAKQ